MKMRTGHLILAALAAILAACAAGPHAEPSASAALIIPPDADARPGIVPDSAVPAPPGPSHPAEPLR
jgi:hypothetical protein